MTGEFPVALVSVNNEPHSGDRQSLDNAVLETQGHSIRDFMTTQLAVDGMRQLMQHDMRYNAADMNNDFLNKFI